LKENFPKKISQIYTQILKKKLSQENPQNFRLEKKGEFIYFVAKKIKNKITSVFLKLVLKYNKGVCYTMALLFTFKKKYLKAKEEEL
jgi:hypothetical protein